MKSVIIQSFFGLYLPVFWLNTEIYSVQIQENMKQKKLWIQTLSHKLNAWIVNEISPSLDGSTTWRFAVGLRAEEKSPISNNKMLRLSNININQSKYLKGPRKISVSGTGFFFFLLFAGWRLVTLSKWSLWWTLLPNFASLHSMLVQGLSLIDLKVFERPSKLQFLQDLKLTRLIRRTMLTMWTAV